jgi:4-amino-4-deoxy-L-arabinose transferase-like glycosyltransferase
MNKNKKKKQIYGGLVSILPILIAGGVLFYWNLGTSPISVWDESLYANIAQDMISYDRWIIPYSSYPAGGGNYSPFFEKFPLLMWIQAISFIIFGQSEFAARFPSATFGILSAVAIYCFGKELYTVRVGFISAISFFTIPYIYAGKNAARQGSLETALLFFGLCFMYFVYRYLKIKKPRWGIGWAIAAGLVVMTKGTAGGIFVIILLPLILMNVKKILNINSVKYTLITFLIVLPWALSAYNSHPKLFINHIVRVTFRRKELYSCDPGILDFMCYPYLQNIWIQTDPIIYIFIPGSLYLCYSNRDRLIGENSFVIWWALVVIVFFSLTGNHPWYLIPAYPAICLLTGKVIADATRNKFLAKVVLIFSGALVFALSPRLGVIDPYLIALDGAVRTELAEVYQIGLLYSIGVVIFLITIVFYSRIYKKISNLLDFNNKKPQLILKTTVALLVLFFFVGVPISPTGGTKTIGDRQDNINSKELGTKTANIVPKNEEIYMTEVMNNYAWSHFVYEFYSDRKIIPTKLQNLDENKNIHYAIIRPSRSPDRNYKIVINAKNTNFGDWLLIKLQSS